MVQTTSPRDQGPGDQGPGDQGPGDQGPGDQGPGDEGPGDEEPRSSRDRLLAAAVEHLARHGTAELSLRGLAAAIGTSHRMLIYHFGSKAGLLVEVIQAVEEEQRRALADLGDDATLPPAEVARRMWARLADPVMWPSERLFFELYGRALQGDPATAGLLDGIVESWIGPVAAMRQAEGMTEAQARARARLEVATTRGLLLDLLATGDRDGVDAALEQFIALAQSP
jgi:AcrR family transcriptional regulator